MAVRQHAAATICRALYAGGKRLSLTRIKLGRDAPDILPFPMPKLQTQRQSFLVDSAMILALILIGVVGYKASPLLLPKADITATPDPACDLQRGACRVALPSGGSLSFALTPRPIPVVAPLEMAVELEGASADRVAVDFAGVSMNMGFNRPGLVPVAGSEGRRFTGQATLPVCVTGRMTWQATVLVESGAQRIAVPYRFDAGH